MHCYYRKINNVSDIICNGKEGILHSNIVSLLLIVHVTDYQSRGYLTYGHPAFEINQATFRRALAQRAVEGLCLAYKYSILRKHTFIIISSTLLHCHRWRVSYVL